MSIEYDGKCNEDGQLFVYQQSRLKDDLKKFFPNKEVTLTVTEKMDKRSSKQLRYLRGVVIKDVQEAWRGKGYALSINQTYEWIKDNFFVEEIFNDKGEVLEIPMDLSDKGNVSRKVFYEKIELLKIWVAEKLGGYIRDPNEGDH